MTHHYGKQKHILNDLVSFLKPFHKATVELSRDQVPAYADVCPCYCDWSPCVKRPIRTGRSREISKQHSVAYSSGCSLRGPLTCATSIHRSPPCWLASPPRGRPRQSWLRTIDSDLKPLNLGLHSALRRATDRPSWLRIVETAMLFERATRWWWWWCILSSSLLVCVREFNPVISALNEYAMLQTLM